MDIKQLRRFVTVAELGSFNRAAELLFVSQPSLTRSIQLLEETLQAKLFERGARGIRLTDMGNELLPHARIILSERDRAMASLEQVRGRQACALHIATEAAFAMRHLPLALDQMMHDHPELRFHILECPMGTALDKLREGVISLAFGARAPYLDLRDISFEPLYTEYSAILVRAGHPILSLQNPGFEALSKARWIVSDQVNVYEGWLRMFARANLVPPTDIIRTSSMHFKRGCLLTTDFVGVGDYTTHQADIQSGQLVVLDFARPYSRPAGLFRRTGLKLSAYEKDLLACLRARMPANPDDDPTPFKPFPISTVNSL